MIRSERIEPSLKNLFDNAHARVFQDMNCVKVGSIVSFDAANRTAEIQIAFKRNLSIPLADGTRIISFPLLVDCPVFTLQGGGTSVSGGPCSGGRVHHPVLGLQH